ncbi:MAG TPA: aminotransferase class V-fold PLP-dependent enzyme, partial [Desulfobacteraceae bacterium]|nr:aminotransferase class V-fold PLP-dependent enzyme [Desulfobacteraceae bacterium]
EEQSLKAPQYLLKPDGGTIALASTVHSPAATAQSGPAASVMGALALDGCPGTALVLDVGGTTTDMSVVLGGVPLLEPRGIRIGPYQTLVRSLLTHSIGIGGDSEVRADDGPLCVGPHRQGPPIAFGGKVPTPTDAMITLGLLEAGDRKAAGTAMEKMGKSIGLSAKVMAQRVLETMARSIADSAEAFLSRINSRPVYTIHEVIQEEKIVPDSLVVIGGPAPQVAPFIGEALGLSHRVPEHFGVANAIGAAVARVTAEITVQADTERGSLVIPEAGIDQKIPFRYRPEDAMSLADEVLKKQALKIGADPDSLEISVIEKQVIAKIHRMIYNQSDAFYQTHVQNTDTTLGVFVEGGTTANLSALWAARNTVFAPKPGFAGIEKEGVAAAFRAYDVDRCVVLVSRLGHYSLRKAAGILGIGNQNMIALDTDKNNHVDISKLKQTISRIEKENPKTCILAIVGIAGATETGTIDPLEEMAKICAEHRIHFHVDAAWGGPTLFSKQYKHLLNGIHLADSVTIDGHKQFYMPMSCGMLYLKDPKKLDVIAYYAHYVNRWGSVDLGIKTLSGSREANSLILDCALKIMGANGYALLI